MAKLNTKKASSNKRVILFGASFSGKSLLAGRLAEYFNLLWIDLEKGHGVLHQLPEAYKAKIEVVDLPDTRSYPIAIESMLKIVKGPVDICEQHGKVSCMVCRKEEKDFVHVDINNCSEDTIVVIDTLTQLSNSAISNITKSQPDDYKLTYDDYGNLGKLLDIVLSHVQQANYKIVCISHENVTETEGKKAILTPTGGTRNFSRNITKYFTDVVYLERKNRKHMCISSTTAATNIIAGSQTGIALENLGEPSLLPLFKPELFPDINKKLNPTDKPQPKTGGTAAQDILARIKAKKNKPK